MLFVSMCKEKENFQCDASKRREHTPASTLKKRREYEMGFAHQRMLGHPMEAYIGLWEKKCNCQDVDFIVDEETGEAQVRGRRYCHHRRYAYGEDS